MRALVIGAGISGLAAALRLQQHGVEVVVAERSDRVGGKLRTSRFAGIDSVDEGADAYLTRVPQAVELTDSVGIVDLRHPTGAHAAIWHDGLHRLPAGVMLGVPSSIRPLATTPLLSWRGKIRAVADLVLPRTSTADDSLGAYTRARLGGEVHERLIDALIGSIYATDTDNSSLDAVPQLAGLASGGRSMILTARQRGGRTGSAPMASDGPIFAAPRAGMEQLAIAAADQIRASGGELWCNTTVSAIVPADSPARSDSTTGPVWSTANGLRVELRTPTAETTERFDAIVCAAPAPSASRIFGRAGLVEAADAVGSITAADVTIVRLRIPAGEWSSRLDGLSGYLVPKPDQQVVTAASFGSQKWSTWQPKNGDQIVRASLGRDGLRVDHLDDAAVREITVYELERHLQISISPSEFSITRWMGGFPQYRPRHRALVAAIEASLPPSIAVAGASYHGIGVPACIASGTRAADLVIDRSRSTE